MNDFLAAREQERALAGTRGEWRPNTRAEIQTRLDAADAALPDDLKQQHPIRPLAQIERDHRNRWVALLPTGVTAGIGVASGRVLAEAADRASLRACIVEYRRRDPPIGVVAYFCRPGIGEGDPYHAAT